MWEFAWLIEDVRNGRYYAGSEWTDDHMKAIRYSRKIDATRAILALPEGMHLVGAAVEHGWTTDFV